jgi:hypothetical protein
MFDSAINWYSGTSQYTNSSPNWSRIAYGNGLFVVIEGAGNNVMCSSNGSSWQYGNIVNGLGTKQSAWGGTETIFQLIGCRSIAFGNERFVASDHEGRIFYSTDGKNWIRSLNAPSIKDVAFGSGRFVSFWNYGGNSASIYYYSSDGVTWTQGSFVGNTPVRWIGKLSNIGSVFRGGARLVADNSYRYATSSNGGVSWTSAPMPTIGAPEQAASYYDQSAVGNCLATNTGIRQDYWVFLVNNWDGTFNGSLPTNKCAVAKGTVGAFVIQTFPSSQVWCSVAFGNERFVVIAHGSNSALCGQVNRITTNIVWTPVTLPFSLSSKNQTPSNIVFGGGSFSPPSVTWGNGRFVIVDPSLKSAYSIDGINWVESASLPSPSKLALDSIYPFSLSNILNVPSEFI